METTLQQSLEVFYNDNNFGEEGGINNDWVWLKFRFFSIPIPNFEERKTNIWKHDILHILLEYDTSWKGETSVAGWTLGSGGWGNILIAWFLDISAFGIGLIIFPKSTYQAFIRGRHSLSPHLLGIAKEKLFCSDIEKLKHDFEFDKKNFKANLKDKLVFADWVFVTILFYCLPILALIILFLTFK